METTDRQKRRDERGFWVEELERAKKWHREWRECSRKVLDRYSDDRVPFNILYSNVETIEGALIQDIPKPAVTRRYKTGDPVSRQGAELLERALEYAQTAYNFQGLAKMAIRDYLLPACGQLRVRYEPQTRVEEVPQTVSPQVEVNEAGEQFERFILNGEEVQPNFEAGVPYVMTEQEVLETELVFCELVPWDRFTWQPAKTWQSVDWCCIDHHMSVDDLREFFPRKWMEIECTVREGEGEGAAEKALVHEIFDKATKRIIFISPGYERGVLKIQDDTLQLEGFYPFPEPLLGTVTTDGLRPIPDYMFYQEQAEELNRLTERLMAIIDAMKVRGIYDSSFKALAGIMDADDTDLLPVDNFAAQFQGRGDLGSVLRMMPLEELQRVALALYDARERTKQIIYEITGISDIVRGASQASETATAQRIKGQFASLRLRKRIQDVQRFLGDVYKIKAEIIANHFDPETLNAMTGVELTDELLGFLRSDAMRNYKVQVDADSLIVADEETEKQARMEFMSNFVGMYGQLAGMVAQQVMQPDMAREALMFMAHGFRGARQFEESLEQAFVAPQPMAVMQGAAMSVPPNDGGIGGTGGPQLSGNVAQMPGIM